MTQEEITKRIQQKELEMLNSLVDLFEKNNIPYFLAFGTLLGCVRHKNFIPWDDDVDIYCYGRDLERIRTVLIDNNCSLEYQDGLHTKDYPYWFPKIVDKNTVLIEETINSKKYKCGVYIDVFPLIDAPFDKKMIVRLEKKRYFYYGVLRSKYNILPGFKNNMLRFISHFFSTKHINKKLYSLYNASYKSDFFIDSCVFVKSSLLRREWFETVLFMEFANNRFRVPGSFSDYLTHFYDKYMVVPPKEKQISNHCISYLMIDGVVLKGGDE